MDRVLKHALVSNAAFSALCGIGFVLLGDQVAALIGLGDATVYRVVGAGLSLFAACVAWLATRNPINAFHASLISVADLLWVAGTAGLIAVAYPSLRTAGIFALLIVAAIVLVHAIRQLHGIEQMYAVPGKPRTSRLCVAVATPADADALWMRIADLGGIKRYSPTLTQVILRDNAGPGQNAVRQCTDQAGKTWAEHCKRLDDAERTVEMNFLANESGFPFPFGMMNGGWAVKSLSEGSIVTIWFEVTPKYGPLHPLILALMSKDLARSFGDTVTRMVIDAQGAPVPVNVNPALHGVSYQLAGC
jgi:Polyketide cyclase / dehydrase and lipid transport